MSLFHAHIVPEYIAEERICAQGRGVPLVKCPRHAREQVVQVLVGHRGAVRVLALSTDGKLLYSGSNDCTIRTWSAEGGEVGPADVMIREHIMWGHVGGCAL